MVVSVKPVTEMTLPTSPLQSREPPIAAAAGGGGAAGAEHATGALKRLQVTLSKLWRPPVQSEHDEVETDVLAPPRALGEGPSWVFQLLVASGVPCFRPQHPNLCLQLRVDFFLCVKSSSAFPLQGH